MDKEDIDRPQIPGYVSIKEAAKMLGVSDRRVYSYIDEGRLPSMWASRTIMIPINEVKNFKPMKSGRPRVSIPRWRISTSDNMLYITSIQVHVEENQKAATLFERWEEIKQSGQHTFPGTVARYIAEKENNPEEVEIILVWRSSVMPTEDEREQALEAFRQALNDVLDWSTARYSFDKVYMHT